MIGLLEQREATLDSIRYPEETCAVRKTLEEMT